MEENTEEKVILTAKASYGFKRVVVSDCPYCHLEHTHSMNTNHGERRMSDCLAGEYIVDFGL